MQPTYYNEAKRMVNAEIRANAILKAAPANAGDEIYYVNPIFIIGDMHKLLYRNPAKSQYKLLCEAIEIFI